MAGMSLDDLRKLREAKKIDLRKREIEGKESQIIVGMGTCGIAAGAKAVLEAFLREVDARKLVDGVIVRQIGCMGDCANEPIVEVIARGMPAAFYGKVDEAAAKKIVEKHVIGGEILQSHAIARPAGSTVNA